MISVRRKVCYTFFKQKSIHKYTRVGVGRDGIEVKSMIDLVLVKEILKYVLDVKSVRGLGMGLSDHYVVLCKIKLVEAWMKRKVIRKEVGRIKSEKLNEKGNKDKYLKALASKSVECEQVETEKIWKQMKEAIVSSAKEVCECAKVGSKNVKSEWWNEEVM